jgi:FtsP/CotA-like multicopper oxidase with cupredoxin domain
MKPQPIQRREFLRVTGGYAVTFGLAGLFRGASQAQGASSEHTANADFALRIQSMKLEIAPGHVVKTTAYNGSVPGPVFRVKRGVPVAVDVFNETEVPELVHWHGLFLPPLMDGAAEEGSPYIPAKGHFRYSFVPEPAGTRYYHTHLMAGQMHMAAGNMQCMLDDPKRMGADYFSTGTYTGQFGFFLVEPSHDPGNYDQEVLVALHHWEPYLQSKGPGRPGVEVKYRSATMNGKMLGHGEPLRVKRGDRILFRILNASATKNLRLALPGHAFRVLALDGNPVPNSRNVSVLELGVAERADAIVEMDNPGVLAFAGTDPEDRNAGLGMVVEYSNRQGEPVWQDPAGFDWDYLKFGTNAAVGQPDERVELVVEKIAGGPEKLNRWTINGKSFPDTDPILVEKGKRYRLVYRNESPDTHPLHLHRHSFELTN